MPPPNVRVAGELGHGATMLLALPMVISMLLLTHTPLLFYKRQLGGCRGATPAGFNRARGLAYIRGYGPEANPPEKREFRRSG